MNLESALQIQAELLEAIDTTINPNGDLSTESLQKNQNNRVSVGLSRDAEGDARVEVRVVSKLGRAFQTISEFAKKLGGDLNVEELGPLQFPKSRDTRETSGLEDLCKLVRPLMIGQSIAHEDGQAGTIGGFVRDQHGNLGALSASHVIARSGQVIPEEVNPIHQPGSQDIDGGLSDQTQIGRLGPHAKLSRENPNKVDAAVAILLDPIESIGNKIPSSIHCDEADSPLSAPLEPTDISRWEEVVKIGRSTGRCQGIVSAINFKHLYIRDWSRGYITLNNLIEVQWTDDPFALPGDSGALVYTKNGLHPIGIHVASGHKKVKNKKVPVSYASPIKVIEEALNVEWMVE